MYCFTLYWNKLQILTWSVSWAADNEQLRDTTRLNQYSCLKGMSMTIFQNLLLPCEIDKYTKRCIPPHLGLIICTWSAAAIQNMGESCGQHLLPALPLWLMGPAELGRLHSAWTPPPPQVPLSKYYRCFFLQAAVRLILLLSIKRLHSLHYTAKKNSRKEISQRKF